MATVCSNTASHCALHRQSNSWLPVSRRLNGCRVKERSISSRSQTTLQHAEVFDSLASLLCHNDMQIGIGVTQLGRGIVAKEDLAAQTTVLTVDAWSTLLVCDEPLRTGDAFGASVLSDWQSLWSVDLPPQLNSYLKSSRGDWFRRLVAWLLWLKRHNDSPVWQMYLQLMPQEGEMCSLMNYTPEERAELQLPHLIELAEKEREGIQGLHASLFSSSTGELQALDLAPDFTDTLWAACMVNSRCFSDAAGRELLSLMVPLADMANHSNDPNAAYRLDPGAGTFSVTSTKAIAAGSEVLISYLGEKPSKSSTQLMKDYGFIMPGNTNDSLTFTGVGSQEQLLSPIQLLEAAAAAAAAASPAADSPAAESPADSREAAVQKRRIQVAIKSLQPYVAQPSMQPSALQGANSSGAAHEQQQQLVQQLRQECQQQLAGLPTSIQEDMQLQNSAAAQASVRLQTAIAARLEHKLLLAAAVDVLDSYEALLTAEC